MVKRLAAVLLPVVAGCSGAAKPVASSPETVAVREDDATRLARLFGELQDDILTSYERDEPPDFDTGMIDPRIGTARIGAGPGDLYVAGDLAHAPSRWPLDVDRAIRTEVRSKHLEIQIAADQTAAWMADELSWRIDACGRTAVIPLRITALYAHDGDRWVPVFEHLSYGWPLTPLPTPLPRPVSTEVASDGLAAALLGVVDRGLVRAPHDPSAAATDPGALVLGPGASDEWHGARVLAAQLPAGKLEDRRIGLVGRRPRDPTIAYWIGNYLADAAPRPGAAAGKVGLRISLIFERRSPPGPDGKPGRPCAADARASDRATTACPWVLVQSQLSQPITDDELAKQIFGDALISAKPLTVDCSDGSGRRVSPGRAPSH
jgi:hypothetical protein